MQPIRRALLCASFLVLALAPAATAGDLVSTTCVQESAGPATATVCTPRVDDCVTVGFGDGGLVSLCLDGSGGDADGDGYTTDDGDCDDNEPTTYPGAPEQPDGMDNDCDGMVDEDFTNDADGDGWAADNGDCDDSDPSTYPGAPELPQDGADNDCDGMVDEA